MSYLCVALIWFWACNGLSPLAPFSLITIAYPCNSSIMDDWSNSRLMLNKHFTLLLHLSFVAWFAKTTLVLTFAYMLLKQSYLRPKPTPTIFLLKSKHSSTNLPLCSSHLNPYLLRVQPTIIFTSFQIPSLSMLNLIAILIFRNMKLNPRLTPCFRRASSDPVPVRSRPLCSWLKSMMIHGIFVLITVH